MSMNWIEPMNALLGLLTSPQWAPLPPLALLGFCATLDWRWLIVILLANVSLLAIAGWGRLLSSSSFLARVLKSYASSNRYECREITLTDPDLIDRFELAVHNASGATAVERNKRALRLFRVKGRDTMARLSTVSQCFPGNENRPAIIFLRLPSENLRETNFFELWHELGHASKHSDEVEALRYVEPAIIGVACATFLTITNWHPVSWLLAAAYCLHRLRYWFRNRREIEPEIIADAFALKCEPDTHRADLGSASIRDHLERVASDSAQPWPTRDAAKKRLAMLRLNLQLHRDDRRQIVTHSVNYDIAILALNVVFSTAGIWGTGRVSDLILLLGGVATAATAIVFSEIWRKRHMQAQFDHFLKLVPGALHEQELERTTH